MALSSSNRTFLLGCMVRARAELSSSCVYYCMEYMDAGSLDKLQGGGVPEDVLGRITGAMVRGLKFLKDELQIIHRGQHLLFCFFTRRCIFNQTQM